MSPPCPPPGAHRRAPRPAAARPGMLVTSLPDAVRKLDPRVMWRNPVMFIVEVGAVLTTVLADRGPVGVRLGDHRLAVADRGVRQPGRGGRRGPRQGPGRDAAQDPHADGRAPAGRLDARRRPGVGPGRGGRRRPRSASATACWSRPARSSPVTATSSRAWPASTSRRSPASRRRSSASPAATARRSPAARRCCPTGSSCRSPAEPGETFIDRMIALVEGAVAAEDPERDRAEHPARQPDDHLPAGRGDAAAAGDLLRRRADASPCWSRCWSA